MADLTPDQAIEKLKTLPEDKQRAVLGRLSPELRKGILSKLQAPTAGQRYMAARRAGQLPRYEASEVPGILAEQELTHSGPAVYRQGKFVGNRPFLEQVYHGMKSGLLEAGEVSDKLLNSFQDPKNLAAFVIAKLSPAGQAAAATYFGLQSAQGMADALHNGQLTPENVQNFLLSASGYVGAATISSEQSPRTIKERLASVQRGAQKFARNVTEVTPTVKTAVQKAGEVGQHMELAKSADEQATTTGQEIKKVENQVYQEVQRKFGSLREKIGADQPGEPTRNPQALIDVVKNAETGLAPDQQGLFRRITKMIETPEDPEAAETRTSIRRDVMTAQGMRGSYEQLPENQRALVDRVVEADMQRRFGDLEQQEGVGWSKLQRMKTATEKALRSASTAPTMKYALGKVDNAIIETMGSIAQEKGATADWQAARDFNRQWREDFHEGTGPQGSGSPIAQTLLAIDPKNIRQALSRTQGPTGNRAVTILRKYGQFGGNAAASSVENIITTQAQAAELPKRAPGVSIAGQEKPTVDIDKIAYKQIENTATRIGRLNAWDFRILAASAIAAVVAPFIGLKGGVEMGASYVGGKYAIQAALKNPRVATWIARTPPAELAAFQRLPGIDKVNVQTALTQAAIQTRTTPSPDLANFLGPQNVARISAAIGPSQSRPANRREALQKLGR